MSSSYYSDRIAELEAERNSGAIREQEAWIRVRELEAENARLNEAASKAIGLLTAERDQLRQQLEAAQQDAELYQWLREQDWSTSKMAVVMRSNRGGL